MKISSSENTSEYSSIFMSMVNNSGANTDIFQSILETQTTTENESFNEIFIDESVLKAKEEQNKIEEELSKPEEKLNSANFTAQMLELVKSGESFADAYMKTSEAQFKQLFEEQLEITGNNVKAAIMNSKSLMTSEISDEELLEFVQGLSQDYSMTNPDISKQLTEFAQELMEEMDNEKKLENESKLSEENNSLQNYEIANNSIQYPKNNQDFLKLFQQNQPNSSEKMVKSGNTPIKTSQSEQLLDLNA